MKRLLLAFVLIVTITGCSNKYKQSNFKTTEVFVSGTILSIKQESVSIANSTQEDGVTEDIKYNNVEVISTDDIIYNIYFNETIDVTNLHPDTQVNIKAYTVYDKEYLKSESFEITSQPTQYIVGVTAEELISRPANHDKQMSHIDYIMIGSLDYKSDGMFEHIQSKSQTVRSDTYTRRHVSTERNIVKDKDINESSIYEYYLTKNETLRRYFNDNYTGWYYEDTNEEYIMQPNFTFQSNDFTVDEYIIDDNDRIVVKGDWIINFTNFVGDGIWQLLSTYDIKSADAICSFTAIYDRITLDLYNIQFDITTEVDGVYEDTKASIKEFTVNVYGIEYDTEPVIVIKEARCYA